MVLNWSGLRLRTRLMVSSFFSIFGLTCAEAGMAAPQIAAATASVSRFLICLFLLSIRSWIGSIDEEKNAGRDETFSRWDEGPKAGWKRSSGRRVDGRGKS